MSARKLLPRLRERCPRCEHTERVQKITPAGVSGEMKKLALTAALLLALAGSALAESYRVTYTTPRGQIHRVTVQAESSGEARRVVMVIFPGCTVTGSHKVK
jgi:hypothetical protein